MRKLKLKLLNLFHYQKLKTDTRCEIFTNETEYVSGCDCNTYIYNDKGKRTLKFYNGKFVKKISDKYFLVTGNSILDSHFIKEFFIIEDETGKVLYKSNRGDKARFFSTTGENHYYVIYGDKGDMLSSCKNFIDTNEPEKSNCYNKYTVIGTGSMFYNPDGTVDVIARNEYSDSGIVNYKSGRAESIGSYERKSVGYANDDNYSYFIDESGFIHLKKPFKYIDIALFSDYEYKIVGILNNGMTYKVDPKFGELSHCESHSHMVHDDYSFREIDGIYQLLDKDGNVLRGGFTDLFSDFSEREFKGGEKVICAEVMYKGYQTFVNKEGKVYVTYRNIWE